jgi:hypothetical protein
VCLLTVSAAGLFLKTHALIEARASTAWPSTDGRITRADVAGEPSRPKVAYAFRVGGREFVGERVRISSRPAKSAGAAGRSVERFTPGQRVRVYYDPADPSRSVLISGADWRQYATVLVLLAAAGAGATLLAIWRRRPPLEGTDFIDTLGRP